MNDDDAARRRKRRTALIGGVASVALVLLGSVAVQQALRPDVGRPVGPVATTTAPHPPAGMRWVGRGRVVVAVPADWTTNAVRCGQPVSNTVYFTADRVDLCGNLLPRRFSSLLIAGMSTDAGRKAIQDVHTPIKVNGVSAVRDTGGCLRSYPSQCFQTFTVPSQGVVFSVTSPDATMLDAVRNSLRRLPKAYTTVPYDPDGPAGTTLALMRQSGLTVKIVHERRAGLAPGVILHTDPPPGGVIAEGSTVTVTLSSGPGRPHRRQPGDPAGVVTGTLLFVGGPAPGSPRPLRGTVTFTGHTESTVRTDGNGHYSTTLPVGTYRLTAHSPQFGSGTYECRAGEPIRVTAESETDADVYCQAR